MEGKLIIASDSCDGKEREFEEWVNSNYPNIETSIELTIHGGYYENGELEENKKMSDRLWKQFCSQ